MLIDTVLKGVHVVNIICKVRSLYKEIALKEIFQNEKFAVKDEDEKTVLFLEELYFPNITALLRELSHQIKEHPNLCVIILSERMCKRWLVQSKLSIQNLRNEVFRRLVLGPAPEAVHYYYSQMIQGNEKTIHYNSVIKTYILSMDINTVAKIYNISCKRAYYYISKAKEFYAVNSLKNLISFYNWLEGNIGNAINYK